jgi:predicted unusual protein kinase regulating ubiquinone biosynthesis (AarF/ABC1/UbiB family)
MLDDKKKFMKVRPNNLKLVSINELAHGDLKTLVYKRDIAGNNELMLNILYQVFISIGTFQNLVGYVHNDAHYGNFLYQMNNEKGYYQYEFDGKKYYLKACGYNMMIYDFGLSENISTPNKLKKLRELVPQDYARIINAFFSKQNGWGEYFDVPTKKCEAIVKNIQVEVIKLIIDLRINNKNIKTPKEVFKNILENALIPYAPAGMFLTTKPKGTIINSTPYKIG